MIIIHDESSENAKHSTSQKRKFIIIMLTTIIVTIYIDKLGCFDVAELMQSFLGAFYCWRHSKEAYNESVLL